MVVELTSSTCKYIEFDQARQKFDLARWKINDLEECKIRYISCCTVDIFDFFSNWLESETILVFCHG